MPELGFRFRVGLGGGVDVNDQETLVLPEFDRSAGLHEFHVRRAARQRQKERAPAKEDRTSKVGRTTSRSQRVGSVNSLADRMHARIPG
jgi:hypothetical protein